MPPAEDDASLGIARMQGELPGSLADLRLDERGIEAHAIGRGIDVGAGRLEDRLGFLVQKIDADLLQDGQRRTMN